MSHGLPFALLALIAWASTGCESIAALTQIEPLARRVGAVESQVEGKADRKQVEQLTDVAQRADQGALRAGDLAQGAERSAAQAERSAAQAERSAAQVEAAGRRSESELRAEIGSLKEVLKSQTAVLGALEERLAVVEQRNRERPGRARATGPSWPPSAEAARRRSESELRAEIGSLKKVLKSQTAALGAREDRLAVVEQSNRERRGRARPAGPSGPPSAESRKAQDRLRTEGVLTQVKADVAAFAGIGAGQLEHVELAGFLSGSADVSPVMEADQRARAQIEALKRMLAEGRAEVIQIASFDDKLPCRQAAHDCRTIGLRRGLNTASFLGAPKGAVDARPPTDRWGPPAENRRVVVFYVRKDGAQLAPAPGPGRPTTPAAAPSGPPAATTPTTARPR